MSNRIEKVNSLLEHEIANILLKEFHFDNAIITLTHVDATANLQQARAYVSVMPEENSDKIIKTLNNDIRSVQQKINKKLNMRPIPRIEFVKDEKISHAAKIEKILTDLKKEEK